MALNATSEPMMAGFPDTQDSNREGRKRKASRAEVAPPLTLRHARELFLSRCQQVQCYESDAAV